MNTDKFPLKTFMFFVIVMMCGVVMKTDLRIGNSAFLTLLLGTYFIILWKERS